MSLSLVKTRELKDAGFTLRHADKSDDWLYEIGKVPLAIPNLSELIDACGDKIVISNCDYHHIGWVAGVSVAGWDDGIAWIETADRPHGIGSTPEEAVANLWLALNKKQ